MLAQSEQGLQQGLALVGIAGERGGHGVDALAPGGFRVPGIVRDGRELDERPDAVVLVGKEFAPEPDRRAARFDRVDRTGEVDRRADRMKRELEGRDDAEVAAAALERPEQVGVLVRTGPDQAAIGGDHLGRDEIVDRQAIGGS